MHRLLILGTCIVAVMTLLQSWAQGPLPLPDRPKVIDPSTQPCPPGTFRAPGEGRCQYINPPPTPEEPEVELLPPPPGVIVLKPGKVREQAEACPEGSQEVKTYNDWRFCLAPGVSQADIPPLWAPPIAGIPYEKALEIHYRHVDELSKLPGVDSVGLRRDGIHVSTSNPAVVPSEVEGLPIIVDPPEGPKKALSHTYNTDARPSMAR